MKAARTRARRARPAIPRPRRPSGIAVIEGELLALARRVSAIAAEPEPPRTSLRGALDALLEAYAADARLRSALLDAWRLAATDKRAALALAWAREQLRLAVADVLAREAKADRLRPGTPLDALAWVTLAAAEAVIHELPGSAPDRVDALVALARPSG